MRRMRSHLRRLPPLVVLALLLQPLPGLLAPAAAQTGLPIPRFVTLRAETANLRTGPGERYPVEWIFARRGLPVEVIAEFDTWRRIRDADGVEGWVHQSLLSGSRGLIVRGAGLVPLRMEPEDDGYVVAEVEPGVVGRLLTCPAADETGAGWCRVEFAGTRGWMRREAIWGVYPDEVVE